MQRCNTTCEQATLTHIDDVTTLPLDSQSCSSIDPCPELTVFYGKLVGGEPECSYRIRDEDLCNGAGVEQARYCLSHKNRFSDEIYYHIMTCFQQTIKVTQDKLQHV